MQCPTCGSTDVYRSRRRWYERLFNWLLWFHQRPYRCATCMSRFWLRLEPRVWRHTLKTRFRRVVLTWGWYGGALLLAVVVAWVMNLLHQKSQESNPIYDAAMKQGIAKKLDETDLTPEQKKAAEEFMKQNQK